MGYRRLVKRYMQHVYAQSGSNWLDNAVSYELSQRDIGELLSIWGEVVREPDSDADSDFNQRTVALCLKHKLSVNDISDQLGWSHRIIEEWLLPKENSRHRKMSKRDFQHFESSIKPHLRGSKDSSEC